MMSACIIITGSRFPERGDDEGIATKYSNGILEVRLPVETGAAVSGRKIEF